MNSSIFIQQSTNFQFLSVCHYVTIFGVYFYNKDLITLEEQKQSVTVLNTLFEYLNKSPDESEAKLRMLKIVLKGSDLYGGEENEIIDMKYVNETYQYIISEALFSHYGNINGYLAKIINMADDINYSVLKEKVYQHLLENYTSREYCFDDIPLGNYVSKNITLENYGSKNNPLGNYSSKLNRLTIQKVFDNHIWPIFPQPEKDMSIIDVDYIYAMVGLKIIRSVSSDAPNLTFEEYILISREIYLQDFSNETYEMVLNLFSTPALFFYAYNQRAKFKEINLTLNNEFWIEAYENLFTYMNLIMNRIVRGEIENSLHYKLNKKITAVKSRTNIALEILKQYCDYEHIVKVRSSDVEFYKTFYLWITKLILPKECQISNLPNLEVEYKAQFTEIEKIYNTIVRVAIEKVLTDSKLVKIDSNATIISAQVPNYQNEMINNPRKQNEDIFLLFTIDKEKMNRDFYAFRQVNNVLSILSSRENKQEFAKAVANDSSVKMEIPRFYQILKYSNEDNRGFIKRVADIKAKEFVNNLMMYNYDETFGEKVLNFVSSLIPFYSCIENANEGKVADATLSCALDIVSLIPLAGFAAKYSAKLGSSLTIEISKNHLITKTLRTGVLTKVPITSVVNHISQIVVRTIAREILTKKILKDLSVATLRTVDPGFEFSYQVSRFGFRIFRQLFQNIISNFPRISHADKSLSLLKSLLNSLKQYKNSVSDHTGLVPLILAKHNDYNIVRYFYPSGSQLFGPKCITSFGKTAELRSIEGYSFPIPVVREKSPDGIYYKQYIPQADKFLDFKFKKNSNDILTRVGYLLDKMVSEGRDINIIRNYHVYHNTINPSKIPVKDESADLNQGEPQSANARESIVEQNLDQITNRELQDSFDRNTVFSQNPNSEIQVTLRGNLLGDNIPLVTNVEFVGTLRGNIGDLNFPLVPKFEQPGTSKEILKTDNDAQNSFSSNALKDDLKPKIEIQLVSNTNDIVNENQLLNSQIPATLKKSDFNNLKRRDNNKESRIPEKIQKLIKIDSLEISGTIDHRTIPITSRQFQNHHPLSKLHKTILDLQPAHKPEQYKIYIDLVKKFLKPRTYSRYADILIMWKSFGLSVIKEETDEFYFLRNTLNKLALIELDEGLPLSHPNELWYNQIVTGQNNIDFLENLVGKYFYFNDLTLLRKKRPRSAINNNNFNLNNINSHDRTVEVRYHLKINSLYGMLDISYIHYHLRNNFVTFSDVLFKVTNTYFSTNQQFLYIDLIYDGMSKEYWRHLRQCDIQNLYKEERDLQHPRMKSIVNAANHITEYAPLCTFEISRNFLLNYILSIESFITNNVPTYDDFAKDIINIEFTHSYDEWKIPNNRYIQDVLVNHKLDEVIFFSIAEKRINNIYNFVHFQNIKEAFRNYRKLFNVEQHIRFEDYYVIYSYMKNNLAMNINNVRRFEVAINRIALRQSTDILKKFKIHRAEIITKEMSIKLMEIYRKNEILVFDELKKCFPFRSIEEINFINHNFKPTEISLLLDITLNNHIGLAQIDTIFHNDKMPYVLTANFELIIDSIEFERIYDQQVMVMKVHDYESPKEKRIVRMANRLHELFSTETKFYSDRTRK
ncbi:uncharacterized protein LOC127277440 [Leptopilina boulardi]|uniref:uncharacterized protein LOC127277440 n=1 Tax=Leptopilina boulardi TaxID=63433 RepID=UPI0021F5B1CE|nr:uncharacterized protein LOC127277440 [Leptopilina boulardi]XP_051154510.1 uncharacterized protein LOC127277440 [Leptopilina boulardi]